VAARKTSELLESQHQLLMDSQDVQGVSIQETSPRTSTGTSSDHGHGELGSEEDDTGNEGEGGGHHHHNHDRGGETEGEDTPAGPGLGLGTPALQDGGVAGVGEGGDVAGGGAGRLQRPGSVAPVLMAFNMWDAQKDLVTDFFPHRPARVVAVPRSRSGARRGTPSSPAPPQRLRARVGLRAAACAVNGQIAEVTAAGPPAGSGAALLAAAAAAPSATSVQMTGAAMLAAWRQKGSGMGAGKKSHCQQNHRHRMASILTLRRKVPPGPQVTPGPPAAEVFAIGRVGGVAPPALPLGRLLPGRLQPLGAHFAASSDTADSSQWGLGLRNSASPGRRPN
jgi:hypothetical protein